MKYTWFGQQYEIYTPKRNKRKLGLLGVLAIPFLLTPATNWIYVLGLGLLSKFNPMWIYK